MTRVVLEIHGRKGVGRGLKYHVQWKGLTNWSWEPKTNLAKAQDAIDRYERKQRRE